MTMTVTSHSVATLRARLPSMATEFWDQLFAAYRTPTRHYHTIDHVAEVAGHYDQVAADIGWRNPEEVLLAVLFHDAVYRPGATDNEKASAELAVASARRWWPRANIDHQRIAALIELTASHGRLNGTGTALDPDEAHFLDCDMAILGADPDGYRRYAAAVAREFQPLVSMPQYRAGRRAFLTRVLHSARIFHSDYFHERLNAAARANLARELDELTTGE